MSNMNQKGARNGNAKISVDTAIKMMIKIGYK